MAKEKITFEEVNRRLPDEGYLRLLQIVGGKGFQHFTHQPEFVVEWGSFWTLPATC